MPKHRLPVVSNVQTTRRSCRVEVPFCLWWWQSLVTARANMFHSPACGLVHSFTHQGSLAPHILRTGTNPLPC